MQWNQVREIKMNKYLLIISKSTLKEYENYYFETYPKRRVFPFKKTIPPSLNEWSRMNHLKANTIKQQWKELIIWLADRQRISNLMIEKAVITYTYYFPTRIRHDADNYNGKFCNDGLTASGIIIDDDFDHIRVAYNGRYDKYNPRTEILIEQVEEL